jgi:hypothetical protein
MDTLIMKSNITWTELHFQLAEKMVKPVSQLILGYKFSTDARNRAPNHLSSGVHLLELIEGAKVGLAVVATAKAKPKGKPPKPFKVEIVDLGVGKEKELKGKKASGSKGAKHKKVRCQPTNLPTIQC